MKFNNNINIELRSEILEYSLWFSPLRFGQNYKGLLKIRLQYYLCVGKDDQWRPLYQWLFVTRRPTVTF